MGKKNRSIWYTLGCIGLMSFALSGCRLLELLESRDTPKEHELEGYNLDVLNEKILNSSVLGSDLIKFPSSLNGQVLSLYIREQLSQLPALVANGAVRQGSVIPESALKRIEENSAFNNIKDKTPTFYAVALQRLDLLMAPTSAVWYKDKDHHDSNVLKIGQVMPGEAVAVMHMSDDNSFCYVQSSYARGWLPYYKLMFTGHIRWLEIVKPNDFAVVTSPQYSVTVKGHEYVYYMGDVIMLDKKQSTVDKPVGLFPVNKEGVLTFESVELPKKDFNIGYLKATPENLQAQALAYKKAYPDEAEGPTDPAFNALMMTRVYRSIGIRLPQDSRSLCSVVSFLPLKDKVKSDVFGPITCMELYF